MGFFSRLFNQGSGNDSKMKLLDPIEYKGFLIYQDAMSESGQYRVAGKISNRVAGKISKDVNGEICTHRFIRSDVVASKSDADELMLKKAKMLIDQMGEKIFS
uniref:HlyU family transcriptional regulator n=1 Tax=Vibrio anguillarum TaxID=55601 RepID=UPI0040476997